MCLVVNSQKTKQLRNSLSDEFTVYKVLAYVLDGDLLYTPYMHALVVDNNLIASPALEYVDEDRIKIEGGGIHVYLEQYWARIDKTLLKLSGLNNLAVYQCSAKKEDLIAVGHESDAAFKKIKILEKLT